MKSVLLLLWLSLVATTAGAQDLVEELLESLAGIERLQGDFEQTQYTQDNEILQVSAGRFKLLRPGYFSWDIATPDSQLIIADPEYLWQFDRDLETVTRRPIAAGGQMTPLQILGGDEAALREGFAVSRTSSGDFTLTPLSEVVGFKALTINLVDDALAGMEVLDNLNQRVVIVFSKLEEPAELEPADFAFAPPQGVDLFYHEQ